MQLLDRARSVFTLPPADEEVESDDELQMTITEHLQELRDRIIRIMIGLAVGTIIGFAAAPVTYQFLLGPAPPDFKPITIEIMEIFFNYFKIALFTGAGLSMPWTIVQVIGFVAPGLTRREKKMLYLFMPFSALLFFGGIGFGYFFTLPFAIKFLLNFGIEYATPMIRLENYLSFVTTFLFGMGIGFQTPAVILLLSKIGIVNSRTLGGLRKYAIVGIVVTAALITPTPDPLNQALVAVPLWLLFELGILLARATGS